MVVSREDSYYGKYFLGILRRMISQTGLRRFYAIYLDCGVEDTLEELKRWLWISNEDWIRVISNFFYVYSIKSLWLEYKYRLKKLAKGIIIRH